ncbi:glutamyl-tRNA reductase [Candidatus Methanoperedens nitratireducens]|uniref:Glutamyl-tRNA reductase n=1 Tax=Candidatus Methanoperedens nitratireducens TaxID=1392998 RepID=A0A284VKJ8_9EURY|nr:glutamyl-tRNA reductase [Candidatus Methanoperedens nitroreducens]SNQ59794.1 Glutamyl-tRNA reductase [Candidatus Methanoperedens nitroreducens]
MSEISSMLITHTKASIVEMENAWHGGIDNLLMHLKAHQLVEECAVLKTCNRVEVYVVSPKGSKVLLEFAKHMKVSSRIIDFLDHDESLRHLLRLTSGLESMIVGEDQILGQVKELYGLAKKAGTVGKTLDTAFNKSIQVGKRIRNETGINKGSVSIGSAAVELAENELEGLDGKTVMVIGAGEMGTLVAKALANKEIKVIYVANRTFDKAEALACELNGKAVRYELMENYIPLSDVVISATSAPHFVLTHEIISRAKEKRGKDLMLIDIGNPRNIENCVGEIQGISLHNIDGLRSISEANLAKRREEAKKAEVLIEEELTLLKKQYKRQQADTIISALYSRVETIRCKECEEAINKLMARHTMGDVEREVLDDMTHSFANQILAEPTKILRNAAEHDDERFLDAVAELFKLNGVKGKK